MPTAQKINTVNNEQQITHPTDRPFNAIDAVLMCGIGFSALPFLPAICAGAIATQIACPIPIRLIAAAITLPLLYGGLKVSQRRQPNLLLTGLEVGLFMGSGANITSNRIATNTPSSVNNRNSFYRPAAKQNQFIETNLEYMLQPSV